MTTTRPRRTRPLSARVETAPPQAVASAPEEPWGLAPADDRRNDGTTDGSGATGYQRLSEDVRTLRVGGGTLRLDERTLMILGSVLAAVGLVAILVGWYGAAHSPFLFQQVPYLISGGLLGLALVFVGSIFYFAHWLTELVKEGRSQSAALVEAITRLENTVKQQAIEQRFNGNGGESPDPHTRPPARARTGLVATAKGTMVHRRDCVVVSGKRDVRPVGPGEALEPCRLCDPYAEAAPQ